MNNIEFLTVIRHLTLKYIISKHSKHKHNVIMEAGIIAHH